MAFKNAYQDTRMRQKIERYARIIAAVQLSGTIPADITTKEYMEIAMWDAIGDRVAQILSEHQPKAVGIVSMEDLEGEE